MGRRTRTSGECVPPLTAEDGQAWDIVLLARYPSRQVFADMVHDPDYQAASYLRTEALVEAVLQPTAQLADPTGLTAHGHE